MVPWFLRIFFGCCECFRFHGLEKWALEGWKWAFEGVLVCGIAIRARLENCILIQCLSDGVWAVFRACGIKSGYFDD